MTAKRVFISHAVKDKDVVDSFFDLLQTGVGVSPDETFCSSLEGMGIPPGANFVDHIKGQVQNPELIILMLSPHYLESMFCLCELGAGWALSHNMIPVVIPPTTFTDLKAVLAGIQGIRIDSETDLGSFRDRVAEILKLPATTTPRWDVKRKKFLTDLSGLLAKAEHPATVPYKQLEAAEKKYQESVVELEKAFAEIDKLNQLNESLKRCKDAEAVKAVVRQYTDDWSFFETVCGRAEKLSNALPAVVVEAIYHDQTGMGGTPNGREIWDEIGRAAQDGFLDDHTGNEVTVNYRDPKVKRYVDSIEEVRLFLGGGGEQPAGPDFYEQYEKDHDYEPSFKTRRLWENHLGLSHYTQW